MRQKSISRWMRSFNYGRPIQNWRATVAARYFRPLVGAMTLLLLALHSVYLLFSRPSIPIPLLISLAASFVAYLTYLAVRAWMPRRWERRYYRCDLQLFLAQVGIADAALLLWGYAYYQRPNELWLLFVLPLTIISYHCSTPALLTGMVEAMLVVLSAAWLESGLSLWSFAQTALALQGLAQALLIGLLTFLLHFLVRNLGARDLRIEQLRCLLAGLSDRLPAQRDPKKIRCTSLDLVMETVHADYGAVWVTSGQPDGMHLETMVPANGATARDDSFSEDAFGRDDRLPLKVAQTGRPHCLIPPHREPQILHEETLADLPAGYDGVAQIGILLKVFQAHRPESLGVLVLGFEHPMGRDELGRVYATAVEVAEMLSPIFYYVSLIEENLALRDLGHKVSRSLEQIPVMDALLDLLTTTLGYDFATISLVDESKQIIHTVRGRHVDDEWIASAAHSLDSEDIQAHIVRTGQTEILQGWDKRFDRTIWERFGHEKMVRIFMPLTVVDATTGEPKQIGTVEAGYWEASRAQITQEQVDLLQPFVDQAAVAVHKAQLYARACRHANALDRLHNVGQSIQRAVWSLPHLMQEIGENALDVLQADIVFLYRYDQDAHCVEFLHTAGEVWGQNPLALRLNEGNILDWIIAHRETFYTDEAQTCRELVGYGVSDDRLSKYRTFTQRQKVLAFAGVPLMAGDRLIGIMCVNYRAHHNFSDENRDTIELFAQNAAIALETARLRELDREQTMQLERRHLSRELHDALVQDLYGLELKLRTLFSRQDGPATDAEAQAQILCLAEEARGRLGYLVAALRAPLPGSRPFRETILETSERVRQHYEIDVTWCDEGPEWPEIPAPINAALAHIAQESITNAVRHAYASRIEIRYWLHASGQSVCLQVQDNGNGFDRRRTRPFAQGLRNMREYAQEAQGTLDIHTAPGQGTRITVELPFDEL